MTDTKKLNSSKGNHYLWLFMNYRGYLASGYPQPTTKELKLKAKESDLKKV